jgi:hypothetical protein
MLCISNWKSVCNIYSAVVSCRDSFESQTGRCSGRGCSRRRHHFPKLIATATKHLPQAFRILLICLRIAADAVAAINMSDLNGDAGGGADAAVVQPVAVREKPPVFIYPQLKNVVSSVDLGTRIDLKSITMKMRNAECETLRIIRVVSLRLLTRRQRYNPKRFSAVTIRLRNPKTTALVFESGKMVITGTMCLCAVCAPHHSRLSQAPRARTTRWRRRRSTRASSSAWDIPRQLWY